MSNILTGPEVSRLIAAGVLIPDHAEPASPAAQAAAPAAQEQFDKIIHAERSAHRAINSALHWVDDKDTRKDLKRAEYLLSEMRHAAYFLCDPDTPPKLRQDATARLVDVIITCK